MISFEKNRKISVYEFLDLLSRSTLDERRPVDDIECIKGMLDNANLTITAWDDDKLVGIARSMTDFTFACYLSDLAVDQSFQKQGIGKSLLDETLKCLGDKAKLILVSAPDSNSYYEHIGMVNNPKCWIIDKEAR